MLGMHLMRDTAGRWVYPPLNVAMMAVGLEEVKTYVLRRQNTITHYIVTRLILDICLVADKWPGAQVKRRWWYQAGINFDKEDGRVAERTEEGGV